MLYSLLVVFQQKQTTHTGIILSLVVRLFGLSQKKLVPPPLATMLFTVNGVWFGHEQEIQPIPPPSKEAVTRSNHCVYGTCEFMGNVSSQRSLSLVCPTYACPNDSSEERTPGSGKFKRARRDRQRAPTKP